MAGWLAALAFPFHFHFCQTGALPLETLRFTGKDQGDRVSLSFSLLGLLPSRSLPILEQQQPDGCEDLQWFNHQSHHSPMFNAVVTRVQAKQTPLVDLDQGRRLHLLQRMDGESEVSFSYLCDLYLTMIT